MKTFTASLFYLLISITAGYAQYLQPTEKKLTIADKVTTAWVISVDEPRDDLEESIEDYVKEELGVRLKGRKGLLVAEEIRVPSISAYTGDLKVYLSTVNSETQVAVAFMPGYDISLNSEDYPDEMEQLRDFTRNMIKNHHVGGLQATIAGDEKRLRDLESSLKKNEREYRRLERTKRRAEKRLSSDKTDEDRKFELQRDLDDADDRMATLEDQEVELREEIAEMNDKLHDSQSQINDIESRFRERDNTVSNDPESSEPDSSDLLYRGRKNWNQK